MTFDQWLQTEAHPHLRDAGPLGTEWIRQIYEAGQRNVLPAQAEQRGEVVGWCRATDAIALLREAPAVSNCNTPGYIAWKRRVDAMLAAAPTVAARP